MEAMTINLSNLNFPSGSIVDLRSEYGGIDGIYPTLALQHLVGLILYKMLNIIALLIQEQLLIHGSNISIGVAKLTSILLIFNETLIFPLSFIEFLNFRSEANQDNESANSLGVDSALFDSSFFLVY